MAARAFRIDPKLNTQATDVKKFDASSVKSVRKIEGAFRLECLFVRRFDDSPKSHSYRGAYIVTANIGGPLELDGPVVPVIVEKRSTEAGQDDQQQPQIVKSVEQLQTYVWTGPDRRVLQINAWRRTEAPKTPKTWQKLETPIFIRPGDHIILSSKKSSGALPSNYHTVVKVEGITLGMWLRKPKVDAKDAPPVPVSEEASLGTPTITFDAEMVLISTEGGINDLPPEDRYVYAMPHGRQILPQVLSEKEVESTRVYGIRELKGMPCDIKFEHGTTRLSINREARATLHDKDEEIYASPYVLPEESELHVIGETAEASAVVGVVSRADGPDALMRVAKDTDQYCQVYESLGLLVRQCDTSGTASEFMIVDKRIYYDSIAASVGIPFAPLLAAFIMCPTRDFGTLPFDIVFKTDVDESRTLPQNIGEPERRLALYRSGCLAGLVVAVVPRSCEYVYNRLIPVSFELTKARYTKYVVQGPRGTGIIDSKLEDWATGSFKDLNFDQNDFTMDADAILVPLDMISKPTFDERYKEKYDFYAYPCFDLRSAAPQFISDNAEDPILPKRIEFEHDVEKGSEYVLSQMAANAKLNVSDVSKIGDDPAKWLQPQRKVASEQGASYRLPYFSFFALKKSYTPIERHKIGIAQSEAATPPTQVLVTEENAEEQVERVEKRPREEDEEGEVAEERAAKRIKSDAESQEGSAKSEEESSA